ncbi:hypothetical protein [Bacteroides neonati]|uniref:hypothetical protein n=1 Tax=Bacteroides neonati TaxID=1347393 RepID=UPI0005AB7230|nr:hypothetical protein [Bacteroides neonati]
MNRLFASAILMACCLTAQSQNKLKTSDWEVSISPKGCIEQIVFRQKSGNDTIPFFREKENDGPSFYTRVDNKNSIGQWIPDGQYSYRTELGGIECKLTYLNHKGVPSMKVRLTNRSNVLFQPQKAGLKMGIDTYMDTYPTWFGKYFPTLMRNEATHFYGYLQNPKEHTLGIVSEHPIASWSVDYNLGYQSPAPHWFMGHRIESLNLDLINQLPLPGRHPQQLYELKQNESKEWIISFVNVGALEQLEQTISKVADIPLIYAEQTSYRPNDEASFEVTGESPTITVTDDKGNPLPTSIKATDRRKTVVRVKLPEVGLYTVRVVAKGKQAEAILDVHHTWKWTLEQGRLATLKYHQKPTSHAESWYGFYTAFIAAKYFPDKEIDTQASDYFDVLFNKLHDKDKIVPLYLPNRIQNTSTTIGMLIDKYEAGGKKEDLKKASQLGDWLMNNYQRKDGAYFNHGTVYTSVIYVAKSMLELSLAEKEASKQEASWAEVSQRHYESAKKAIDQLVASQGDFETEGEMTFEDGMISCSALQIGMLALLQTNEKDRKHYTDAMLSILNSHSCLTQLRVPDARRRQGTMRYWEAQYDVFMLPNMFNSPHGWSAWRAYATYYAYLLTGEEKWLTQTFNAMGAFANLIDYKTGDLRWAFVVDPYVEAEQACSADSHYTFSDVSLGNPHPQLYDTRRFVFGESYVNMISDWQTINSQDNDVHEVFKCMGEAVLTNAFIVERPNGEIVGYNCKVKVNGHKLTVIPDEKQISHLHTNLKKAYTISWHGSQKISPVNSPSWLF